MEKLSQAARDAYFAELSDLQSHAAYACRSFPSSVLAGLGLRPVRIPLSADEPFRTGVREDICPLVDRLSSAMEKYKPSVVAGMHTCDMTRRFFQEVFRLTGIPVHQLQLPATTGDVSADFFAEEVERVVSDIILNGQAEGYDPAAAEEWYKASLQGSELLQRIEFSVPPVALQYFHHFFRIMHPSRAVSAIEELIDAHPVHSGSFRLLLTGSPLLPGDDTVAMVTEEAGGFLIPVNCTGTMMFPEGLPSGWNPGSIAKAHFNSQKCVRCRPNRVTFQHITGEIERCRAIGVVLKTLTFCDLWYTEKVRMKESLDVPLLVVDSGLSQGERERTAIRMETFIQSMGAL